MLETGKHGPDFGVNALTSKAIPSPALRFAPNPLLSGIDGGHSILRELGRRGMHLHGHLETIDDGAITFSDDLPERLGTVESIFAQRSGRAIDAYTAAVGIDSHPRHSQGLTEIPGLYVVGLPWPNRHYSAIVGGVDLDARYIAELISGS